MAVFAGVNHRTFSGPGADHQVRAAREDAIVSPEGGAVGLFAVRKGGVTLLRGFVAAKVTSVANCGMFRARVFHVLQGRGVDEGEFADGGIQVELASVVCHIRRQFRVATSGLFAYCQDFLSFRLRANRVPFFYPHIGGSAGVRFAFGNQVWVHGILLPLRAFLPLEGVGQAALTKREVVFYTRVPCPREHRRARRLCYERVILSQCGSGRVFRFRTIGYQGLFLSLYGARRVRDQVLKGRGAEAKFVPTIAVENCNRLRTSHRVPLMVKGLGLLWGGAAIRRVGSSVHAHYEVPYVHV